VFESKKFSVLVADPRHTKVNVKAEFSRPGVEVGPSVFCSSNRAKYIDLPPGVTSSTISQLQVIKRFSNFQMTITMNSIKKFLSDFFNINLLKKDIFFLDNSSFFVILYIIAAYLSMIGSEKVTLHRCELSITNTAKRKVQSIRNGAKTTNVLSITVDR